ncbi:MAG: hypothetical protein ACRD0A_03020, partial [Acidimicrobiales bacterium]
MDRGGDVGRYSSLQLDAAGNPVISYYDGTNGDLKLVHCNDPLCEDGDESINVVDDGGQDDHDVGRYSSLKLDAFGNPAISYVDDTDANLKLARCNDANCEGGNEPLVTV